MFTHRVFATSLGDCGSIPGRVIPKTLEMVLDTSLLNPQQYKVCIKGKVEQSRERSSTLPYTSVLKLMKREPSGRPPLCRQLYLHVDLDRIFSYPQQRKGMSWLVSVKE